LAVKLRLRRLGRKKVPVFRVVAADSRSPRDGRFIEAVGLYNPVPNPPVLEFKEDRVYHWLEKGAQPTDTVRSLLSRKGIWLRWSLMRRGVSAEKINEQYAKWEAARMQRDAAPKARRKASAKKKKAAKGAPPAETETAKTSVPEEPKS